MHRLDCVKSSEVVSLIPSSGSSRRAKCSLETPVATVELFEVAEKKPKLLAAHAVGPSGHARGRRPNNILALGFVGLDFGLCASVLEMSVALRERL